MTMRMMLIVLVMMTVIKSDKVLNMTAMRGSRIVTKKMVA